jgi:Rieske Fe-S protein
VNRKEFIKTCCVACAGGSTMSVLLQGCAGTKMITANIEGSDLILQVSEFEFLKKDRIQFRKYVVVQNDKLQYPVCIYRFSDTQYKALWMRCTHQGTELQAFGDKLHCPAHGSEFNNQGGVENGPASNPLRTFAVIVADAKLKISLR